MPRMLRNRLNDLFNEIFRLLPSVLLLNATKRRKISFKAKSLLIWRLIELKLGPRGEIE